MPLIAFEGTDGAGKSTAAQDLYYQLNQLTGIKNPPKPQDSISPASNNDLLVKLYHQPGGTKLGDKLRAIVKDGDIKTSPHAEFLLFASQYYEFCDKVLKPLYQTTHDEDRLVLIDRYPPCSAYVYSVLNHGITHYDYTNIYDHFLVRPYHPDVIVLFDIDVDNALQRISKRPAENPGVPDKFENKSAMVKTVKGYKDLPKGAIYDESKYLIINANVEKKYVYRDIVLGLLNHGAIKNNKKIVPLLEQVLEKRA